MESKATQPVESEQVKEVLRDLGNARSISSLVMSEGGRLLVSALKQDIAGDIEMIISLFRGNETELRCAIASLKAHLAVYRSLIHSEENVKLTQDELSRLLETEKD